MPHAVEHKVRSTLDYVRLLCDDDRKRCAAQSTAPVAR
jgi:hypothetical protein